MFCIKCGASLPEGATQCPVCNQPVQQPTAAPQQATQNPQQPPVTQPVPQATTPHKSPFGQSIVSMGQELMGDIRSGKVQQNIKSGNFNILAVVSAAVAFFALFLPVAEVSAFGYGQSFSPFQLNAGLAVLGAIVALFALLLALMGKKMPSVSCGATYLLITVIFWLSINSAIADTYGLGKFAFGITVMFIAGIATVATNFINFQLKVKK